MKKFLLSALFLAGMATAASAQDYDFLIATEAKNTVNESGMEILVPYDYKMVADGEEIVVKNCYVSYIDNNPDDYYASYYLMAYTKIVNKTKNDITLTFNSVETEKAVTNAEELGFSTEFGHCLGGQCIASDPFNATVEANSSTSESTGEHFGYTLEAYEPADINKLTLQSKYTVTLSYNGNTDKTFTLNFQKSANVGINGIEEENAAPVYYNLQGIRVDAPQDGQIYIKRQGNKVMKVIR